MDATTVKTYADMYAMTHPSTVTGVYEDVRDGGKLSELQVIAVVLVGWMAASDYHAKHVSAL
jgi:hypothetical protein